MSPSVPGPVRTLSADALSACRLCPRQCRVNRTAGQRGYCGAGSDVEVFRYAPHHGEEPPVSGSRGSGTIFFSRCTMRCLYCQNFRWSQLGEGQRYDGEGLDGILRDLARQGCHNWNLVSPTPWLPRIVAAIDRVKRDGVSLPVVYNTSGFERLETLRALEETVQIYLTDLRYARRETAAEASGAPAYVEVARDAFREMWRQAGALRVTPEGIARSGVICRILVLPGRAAEAVESLRWLADTAGTSVAISVMAQYTPLHRAVEPPWNRPVTQAEYATVCSAVEELGFTEGWVQEYGEPAAEGLIGADMPGIAPVRAREGAADERT